jgi:transcriptional regulator GlxA family with amidase domain
MVAYLQRPADQAQRSLFALTPRGEDDTVRRVVDHVLTHLDADLDTPTLSALVNVSERHLSRLFVAQVGRTPARLVRDARLEAAHQLVTTTTQPLAAVARRCGFGSAEAMRQAFVGRFGLPPSQLRTSTA